MTYSALFLGVQAANTHRELLDIPVVLINLVEATTKLNPWPDLSSVRNTVHAVVTYLLLKAGTSYMNNSGV